MRAKLLLLAVLLCGFSFAVATCNDTVLTDNTTLVSDVYLEAGSTVGCYIVSAPNITLDCAGFSLIGDNVTDPSIGVYSDQNGTRVINCKIRDFVTNGVKFDGDPGDVGSYLYSGLISNTTISAASNAYSSGIQLKASSNSVISNTTATGLAYGVYFTFSNNNTISNATATATATATGAGIYLEESPNSMVLDTTATGLAYGVYGIFISGSSNSVISNTTATGLAYDSIFFNSNNYLVKIINSSISSNLSGIIFYSLP